MDAIERWPPIVVAIVLFFGCKQLPETARRLGGSLRIFRTEVKALGDAGQQLAWGRRALVMQSKEHRR
jgi:Sec-independent protein translocase protein TatA